MVITVFGDEKHVLSALKAGATGYVLKDSALGDIAELVVTLVQGGSPDQPADRALPPQAISARPGGRARRQPDGRADRAGSFKVLNLIAKGFTYKEIAELLGLSPQTMPTHHQRASTGSRGPLARRSRFRGGPERARPARGPLGARKQKLTESDFARVPCS